MAKLQVLPSAQNPLVDLVDDYLNHCWALNLSPSTMRCYEASLRSVFLPWCADQGIRSLGSLDERAFDAFNRSLIEHRKENGQPLSKFTIRSYIRPVRQLLTYAARHGETVLAKPATPRVGRRRREVLSREDIDRLESVCVRERDKVIIRILGDCGLRLSEVASLRVSDITRTSNRAYFHVRGKGDRDRRVPLAPKLLNRIGRFAAALPKDAQTDHLFLAVRRNNFREWTALNKEAVANVVEITAARARLGKRVHAHLFRHSWMTEMLRRGMNPIQLSLIAGASQEVIAQHYQHLDETDAYDAMIRAMTMDSTRPRLRLTSFAEK